MSSFADWQPLRDSGLHARALRVNRVAVAFFKHLFESYEEVGIVRTVETHDDGTVSIAILVPAGFLSVAAEILDDLCQSGAPRFTGENLPPVCSEDWFLASWTRAAEADLRGDRDQPSEPSSSPSASTTESRELKK